MPISLNGTLAWGIIHPKSSSWLLSAYSGVGAVYLSPQFKKANRPKTHIYRTSFANLCGILQPSSPEIATNCISYLSLEILS